MLFTSESVTEGHPDKLADQISDGILDTILQKDPHARVACETALTSSLVMVMGEITTKSSIDFADTARSIIKDVGYSQSDMGLDYHSCAVVTSISKQSPDIAQGVNKAQDITSEVGAGDQGMMFGYATNESPDYLPLSLSYAHNLAKQLARVRKDGDLSYLWPDGKTQVTIEYDERFQVSGIHTIVVSTQHQSNVSLDRIREDVLKTVVNPIIPKHHMPPDSRVFINPTGRFVLGGPKADTGLTGRKIIVDTYGGHGAHGGGCFSGKDPTKVDRSAAYMARYAAKNLVASGVCDRALVQLAYAIGRAHPVSVNVHTYNTNKVPETKIATCVQEIIPLTPQRIIEHLDLLRPIYRKIAAYGHFGVDPDVYHWERLDKVEEIRRFCNG